MIYIFIILEGDIRIIRKYIVLSTMISQYGQNHDISLRKGQNNITRGVSFPIFKLKHTFHPIPSSHKTLFHRPIKCNIQFESISASLIYIEHYENVAERTIF